MYVNQTLRDFCCVLYILDFFYLEFLPGVTLKYHLNSLFLMYQQYNNPVLIWSNLVLGLCQTLRFHIGLKSNYSKLTLILMYQINTIQIILKGDY